MRKRLYERKTFSTCMYNSVKSDFYNMEISKNRDIAELPPILRSCWIKLNSVFRNRLVTLGITPDQYTALRWISEAGDKFLTQSDLKSLMSTDANNIAGLVLRMQNAGLINRKSSLRDQRRKILGITEKGTEKYNTAKKIAIELESSITRGFSNREKRELCKLLEKTKMALSGG